MATARSRLGSRRAAVGALVALSSAVGCLLPSLDRLSGARVDAGAPVDAADELFVDAGSDAGDAACTNVLLNAGFEDKPTCDPWISYGGPSTTSDASFAGSAACRVCGVTIVNVLTPLLGTTVPPGGKVVFSGYVRAYDGKMLASQLSVTVGGVKKPVLLSSTYDPFSFEATFPEGGADPQLRLNGDSHDGGCVLMDELTACVVAP